MASTTGLMPARHRLLQRHAPKPLSRTHLDQHHPVPSHHRAGHATVHQGNGDQTHKVQDLNLRISQAHGFIIPMLRWMRLIWVKGPLLKQ